MATKRKLNATEQKFWAAAFLTEKALVHLKSNGRRLSPAGAAHLAADRADADLVEFQRRRS